MKASFGLTVFTAAALTVACASETASKITESKDSGTSSDPVDAMDVVRDAGGAPTDTAAPMVMPATPTVVSVAKMGGALHVTWKLNNTGLTGVELWRKKDAGTYSKVVSVPGTATSYHDTSANAAGATYCFQVKAIKGDMTSDASNEMCGTP